MGRPIPSSVQRKLEALQYKSINNLSLDNDEYKKCIVWVEEEKIRLLEQKDRIRLGRFDKGWHKAVQEYCKEINANVDTENWKFEEDPNFRLQVLDSLLSLAIHDIYQDKIENNTVKVPPVEDAGGDEVKHDLEGFIASLNKIFSCWNLPQLPLDAGDDDIGSAIECVHTRVHEQSGPKAGQELKHLNIGVDSDDPEISKMIAILRLVHGAELRDLQYNINNILTKLQQITADPKTDSRLGRVGR